MNIINNLRIRETLLLMDINYDKEEYIAINNKIDKLKILIASTDKKCRRSYEYFKWKNRVKKRDNYECIKCGDTNILHVHHLKSYKKYPKLRLIDSNGITLCKECHTGVHSGN